jgi:hypothetical protein
MEGYADRVGGGPVEIEQDFLCANAVDGKVPSSPV